MKLFRRFKDLGLEGQKAEAYDKISREHRMAQIKEEAQEVARHINEGDCVLEVAPGPGYLSIELARLGKYHITGLDISGDLVTIANRNARVAEVEVDFRQGNVSMMPFQVNTFNFIICVLAFKNFKEPLVALNEMYRVLKPGGIALIMDLNRNASKEAMKAFVKSMGFTGMQALLVGALQRLGAYSRSEFESFIAQTEFQEHEIRNTPMGLSIYLKRAH